MIILQGSDYDIGYQYMTQLVQINGKELCSYQYDVEAVYRRDSIHKEFNDEEKAALARFETAIATYAPEWIDTLHGMADGANLADGIAQPLKDILSKAAEQFAKGEECLAAAAGHNESVYDISKATHCFAAAQAYGNQVYEVIVPPTALTVD